MDTNNIYRINNRTYDQSIDPIGSSHLQSKLIYTAYLGSWKSINQESTMNYPSCLIAQLPYQWSPHAKKFSLHMNYFLY